MAKLPSKYAWLAKEGAPRMLIEALELYGTLETVGTKNNPTILAWAKEVGKDIQDVYTADSIPWCGLFMAVVAKRAAKEWPKTPLWALSWATFGKKVPEPMLGDVLVFTRQGGGHVALYVGEDETAYHCLGGNQSDKVCISRIAKNRLYTARRPIYAIGQPANVRKVILKSDGELSSNEQ
jgi:uncharacterized protein (TIGR02594 family)